MKVYAIVCEYGAGSIYEGIEMICKTKKIAESWYNNHEFTGRQYYIEEMEIVDQMWSKPEKKKKDLKLRLDKGR